jgi:hypothetical protein
MKSCAFIELKRAIRAGPAVDSSDWLDDTRDKHAKRGTMKPIAEI